MTITGAIDAIGIEPDGRIAVKGWASSLTDGAQHPVDTILLRGIDRAELRFFSRADFGGGTNRFGFALYLESRTDLFRLRNGDAIAFAVRHRDRFAVPIWSALDDQISALLAGPSAAAPSSVAPAVERSQPVVALQPGETVSHRIEVGSITADRIVMVGREGHLFLIGGSNDVERLYEPAVPSDLIDAWLELIRDRARRFAERGIQFAQMIVPEKQSVLTHAFPHALSVPSPALGGIAAQAQGEPWYIDSLALLRDVLAREGLEPYRQIDTHFTFFGARALWRGVMQHLTGFAPNPEHPPLALTRRPGDLGDKIGKLSEELLWPVEADWPFAQTPVEGGRVIDPPGDAHIGCIREWHCAAPLIDKTLLIFGNSFFGRDVDPSALCWWAARTYRRTIFCWSPWIDWATVEAEKPDIVVCQTIERFLREVPKT